MNIGPKRDIVGTWAKVARANGLRFGVSYHGTPHRVWDEFLPVRYKSDATGSLAGVPYDGMETIADGKGKWWEGMDPQKINGKPHAKNSPCPEFVQQFMLRVQDVIDKYSPDILNFDDNARFDFDAGGRFAPDLDDSVAGNSRSRARYYGLFLQRQYENAWWPPRLRAQSQTGARARVGNCDSQLRDGARRRAFRKSPGKPKRASGTGIMIGRSSRTTPTKSPR